MAFPLVGVPPPLRECALSWRQLYEMGCFFQRELESDSALDSQLRTRGFSSSQVGREQLERWDQLGVLRPVAFSQGPYVSMSRNEEPSVPSEYMVFRNERTEFESWDNYAYQGRDHPHVSALFTSWQVLVAPDAIEGATVPVPLEMLADDSATQEWGEAPRAFFRAKYEQWTQLHQWWDPTLRVLVRLQNRYWPDVRGRVRVVSGESGEWHDPRSLVEFDAHAVLAELQLTHQDIRDLCQHLSRRGHELEFADSAYLLRQMFPRHQRHDFKERARRAQDFYDAAEVLRRFYRDLTGETLPDAEVMARAHSDDELELFNGQRENLLGHGPQIGYDADDAKHALSALGIYPHGIHVIVEGDSEEKLVREIVESLLGSRALEDIYTTNLRGVGGATRIERLLSAVSDYALRTVLIVDNEGDMQHHVDRLLAEGRLDPDDVLVQPTSLEESNLSDKELVSLAVKLASAPAEKRPAATLTLTAADLREYHDDRLSRSGKDQPALANSLEKLARHPEHGSVNFSKGELADAMVSYVADELTAAASTWEQLEGISKRRPVLSHIVRRIIKPLANAPTDRPPRRR
jgi:hypothetical protein